MMSSMEEELFTIGGHTITGFSILLGIVLLAVLLGSTGVIEWLVHRALERRNVAPGTRALLCRTARYIMWVVAGVALLELVGVDLMAAVGAGAVVLVGVGFALQKFLESIVAGFLLLAEREIEPGDVLEIDGELVKVVHIGLRTTVVRSRTDGNLIIPNSRLAQNTVRNRTYRDSSFRVRASVSVRYGSDLAQVDHCLREAAMSLEHRAASKKPLVLLESFGASSIDFSVFVTIDDPWKSPMISSDLRLAVHAQLAESGIEFAYPQLDLHVDAPVVEALARAS